MAEHSKRKKARAHLRKMGYSVGGHLTAKADEAQDKKEITKAIAEHESHMHRGEPKTKLKLKDGGAADGAMMHERGDRKPRGKKGKHTTQVNVIVANHGQQPQGGAMPVPVPRPAAPPMGMPMRPGMPPGAPPGAMAGGPPPMPPHMMPPGAKRGGRAKHKRGGKIKNYPIKDGAGGGEGRLEKARAYGA